MIYDIPITVVEKLEQRISKFIRRWLGFHPTLSAMALYSKHSPCPLPLTSLLTLFKCSKTSALLQLKHSTDPAINSSTPNLDTGSKWSLSDSVKDAESIIKFRRIQGHVQNGKAGLGYTPSQGIPPMGCKEYRKLVSGVVANTHDQMILDSNEG